MILEKQSAVAMNECWCLMATGSSFPQVVGPKVELAGNDTHQCGVGFQVNVEQILIAKHYIDIMFGKVP